MKNYNNEILNDCSWFAEKHRGKNKLSGPHWSTIIRFTKLFDEAARLQHRVDALEDYIADYCSPIISDKYSEIEHLQARVQELEQERRWTMIFRKVIRKPRKAHRCSVCGHEITGEHIYSWSTDVCGSPIGVRICSKCSFSDRLGDDLRNFAKQNLAPTLF